MGSDVSGQEQIKGVGMREGRVTEPALLIQPI